MLRKIASRGEPQRARVLADFPSFPAMANVAVSSEVWKALRPRNTENYPKKINIEALRANISLPQKAEAEKTVNRKIPSFLLTVI